jgi:SAM-dependent methyltransferase
MTSEYAEGNRAIWNDWVAHDLDSEHHRDVERFRATGSSLRSIERDELGDVAGKRLIHLLCNMGSETLSLARLGATVTGVDIADAAIERARELAETAGLTQQARFLRADVYALPDELRGQFDIVYASYGALFWLADLPEWARIVARLLAPGGALHLVEMHPFANALAEEPPEEPPDGSQSTQPRFSVSSPYAHTARPIEEQVALRGAEPATATLTLWNYGMGELLTALIAAGLRLDYLHEFAQAHYRRFPSLARGTDGWWRWPSPAQTLPMLFSLRATK